MDGEYLRKGIIGLSRSLDSGLASFSDRGWFAGHTACAVIAAYYFCRDNPIEPGVDEAVTREVDRLIERDKVLFLPYDADVDVEARSVDDIVCALRNAIDRFMLAGHPVIYAAYALQVLAEKPELATPPVLNGIYALIDYFAERTKIDAIVSEEFFADGKALTPAYENEDDMIQNVFTSLQYAPRLIDRGRLLFNGHVMTHAHALAMLLRLGHTSIARQGYEAHRVHVEKSRTYQAQNLENWKKQFTVEDHPFTLAFWDRDFDTFDGEWQFDTHAFKYLYSFYDLFSRINDPDKRKACELQMSYLH